MSGTQPFQYDIFLRPSRPVPASPVPPHVQGSDTSLAAAQAIAPAAGTLRARVLAVITEAPCTDEEGIERSGIAASTWRPRRVELWEAGLVRQAGTRLTKSGRNAVVWAAGRAAGNDATGT